ncbi:MAG TPA: hypothetical protein VGD81_21425 [Opitutaceae bacterium]
MKRAERPPAEFWAQFERDFRTRQLAAAVEKKRWWFALPSAFSRFSRFQLPLGATAVLAITFLTVREYRDTGVVPATSPMPATTELVSVPSETTSSPVEKADPMPMVASAPAPQADAPVLAAAPASREITDMVPWVGSALRSEEIEMALSPSARSIAANLAAAVAGEPELTRKLTAAPAAIEPRAQTIREPLADVPTPSAARRARLFASYNQSPEQPAETERSTDVRERLASRLSEEQLYETVRRLSGSGDRLIVKF